MLSYFPGGSDSKVSAYNARDPGLIPGSGRSPVEGNGNPLQVLLPGKSHGLISLVGYTVHGVTKSQTRLNDFTFHFTYTGCKNKVNIINPYSTLNPPVCLENMC